MFYIYIYMYCTEFNYCITFSQLLDKDLENNRVKSSVLGG